MNVERFQFVEHVLVRGVGVAFGGAFHETLRRVTDDSPDLVGPVRVTIVRRMSDSEVARLRLEPASGAWYEVRGDADRRVSAGGVRPDGDRARDEDPLLARDADGLLDSLGDHPYPTPHLVSTLMKSRLLDEPAHGYIHLVIQAIARLCRV